jgi:hypothetical protein
MPRQHYGPEAKKQAKRLLEALLAYANYEIEDCDRIQIQFNWQTDKELIVRTKVRYLEELTAKTQRDGKLKKEQIKEALHRLEDFLEILEDNRPVKQGAEDWHFRLKLWSPRHDKEANLRQFDLEWERRRGDLPPDPPDFTHHFQSAIAPEVPEGPVALNSPFYVERPPIESRCYNTITQIGALIRIKAPRQMGKTSLLNRIVDRATKQGSRTVRLNLLHADGEALSSLNQFLRWFCSCVSHELQLPAQLSDYWDEDRGSIVNCTIYFEAHILEQLDSSVVLALDEVDRVFQTPEIARGFFPMLRSWHEEAKTIDIWEQLRLIVVHSTEDYGPLDINQSPFNVGLPIELTEFTPEQVKDLARRYQLSWNDIQVQQLMALVGGHPYLVRLALDRLVGQDLTLEKLLRDAPTDAGIYENHLRRHWATLKENPELAAALKHVVNTPELVRLETMQAYKLYSMGLIKRMGDRVTPRCQLYQQYFQERLRN